MMETERLLLRPMTQDDLEDFYDIFNSDNVGKFVNKMSHESVEKYFERKKNRPINPYSFAVVLKENNKMIGTCGIVYDNDNFCGEISYVFNDRYWNKGYCTEACKAVVEYTFENSKMHRLEADCAENNLASAKVLLEKLKMNFEGKIKNYCKSYDGNIIGFNFYAITRDEYEAKK